MKLNEYQGKALSTAQYPEGTMGLLYCALKLGGEAGEVLEKVGKIIRDHNANFTHPEKGAEIALELGDVLWYIANLSHQFGYTLEEIAEINVAKLESRKQRGVISGSGDDR